MYLHSVFSFKNTVEAGFKKKKTFILVSPTVNKAKNLNSL